MKRDSLILIGLVVAIVWLSQRKPVASVSTSTTAALPDGSVVQLDPLPTVDRSALRNAVDLLIWK
jgi:hypothetical protein